MKQTPIFEFIANGKTVSTVNVSVSNQGDDITIGLSVTPAPRVGRTLPDWPEALSLRGGSLPNRRN